MNKTNVITNSNVTSATKIRRLAQIGMLSAIATVLMYFDFPLPFLAPPFYKIDLSEVPVLIGAFAMGPFAGMMIELIKVLINLVMKGSQTALVGEFANFLIGCSFVVPAGFIYGLRKNKKNAIIGMSVGTVVMVIVGCVLNAYVLLPAYAKAFGTPLQSFIDMGAAIHASITNVFGFVMLAVAPFNIVKGVAVSILTVLLYKHISKLLKA